MLFDNFNESLPIRFHGKRLRRRTAGWSHLPRQAGIAHETEDGVCQRPRVARRNDEARFALIHHVSAVWGCDDRQTVRQRLQLRDSKSIGKRWKNKNIAIIIQCACGAAGNSTEPTDVLWTIFHNGGGDEDIASHQEFDGFVNQQARGFDQVLDAFAKRDISKPQDF